MGNVDDHLQNISECPDCASENIVHSTMRDQVICKDCGLVFEPFAAIERPAGAAHARKAKPSKAKKAKPKARKAKAKKAKPAKKARAKAKPAKKAKKSKSKKKFGWW